MAYCVTCQLEDPTGRFCAKCGKQLVDIKWEQATEVAAPNASLKNQAMWAHLGAIGMVVAGYLTFITWALLWLPGFLISRSSTATEFDKRHARESLNYQLTSLALFGLFVAGDFLLIILMFTTGNQTFGHILWPYALITLVIVFLNQILGIILSIIASVAASRLQEYRYPLSFRFVK